MVFLNPSWLIALQQVSPPGESLKYDEIYVELKNKVGQVSFDIIAVIESASALLLRSYDWQVCQFLLLGCAAGGYLDDFIIALKAYAHILTQGEKSYPCTQKARQSALYWLNHSSIIALLQKNNDFTQEWLLSCEAEWLLIQNHLKSYFSSEDLSWHALGKWIEQKKTHAEDPIFVKINENINQVTSDTLLKCIESEHQSDEYVKMLWEFYWKKENKLKAMCLSRAHVWALSKIPEENFGKTYISPVRQADKTRLRHLHETNQWRELWEYAEHCFMQPGGAFDVQLQYYILNALEKLEEKSLLIWAAQYFIAWKTAFPEVLSFHFNDGSDFCTTDLKEWVNQIGKIDREVNMNEKIFFIKAKKMKNKLSKFNANSTAIALL